MIGSNNSSILMNEEVPAVYSEWKETPAIRFRLMIHPISLPAAAAAGGGGSNRDRAYVGAFVETARRDDFPQEWIFQQGCRFHIYAINPKDIRRSIYRQDTFQFSSDDADRGWHQFASHHELLEEHFLSGPQPGALYLRAGCSPVCAAVSRRVCTPCPPAPLPPAAAAAAANTAAAAAAFAAAAADSSDAKRQQQQLQQQGGEESPPAAVSIPLQSNGGASAGGGAAAGGGTAAGGMGRCGRGFVGLRNHGATCYVNALLQSLYFIGRLRQAVYALSFDTRNTSGPRSVDILERRRCRRKRGRGFPVPGLEYAKRGEAPPNAAAANAAAAAANAAATADAATTANAATTTESPESGRKAINGTTATLGHGEGQMDVEEATQSPSAAAAAAAAGETAASAETATATAASAAAALSDESTDSEDELSDLEESELRDLLMEEEAERRSPPSISLALQNLFLKLYTSSEAVSYKELIRSFGWDAADAFTQQDTHELLKLLLDKVEEQMRGTPAEGSVKAMFEGEMETYVECINVTYKSIRKEAFEDINLDVQGCSGVRESLQRLVMPELLEGDNAYDAEQHGKQTARKGIRFLRFPPICVFLLKRFDFDFVRMDTVKVFDR